ncbi:MAG: HAMP domain-containing protein [Anaerolineae bacterium]|jgi:two-component system OmpR family sensor kinase|nr:HAMP domain-containing protein [Anaerolineae bacterium]
MTIRTRLTFLYSSMLAIVILMFSTITSTILNWTLRDQVDDTLLKVIEDVHGYALMSTISFAPEQDARGEITMPQVNSLSTPGLFVQIWLLDDQSSTLFLHSASWSLLGIGQTNALDPHALNRDEEERRDVTLDDVHMRVVTVPIIVEEEVKGYIQSASPLSTVDAAIDRLLQIMLGGGVIMMLLSLLLGDLVSRRALRPIGTITQIARQITAADDLSRRIPYDGPPDEIGQLTQTFNKTLERLDRLFEAQRRFVADVSHEMRTPLTTIQGNLDLMNRIGHDKEAMEAIDGETQRMSRLVEDLLMLARADAGRVELEQRHVDLDTLLLEVYNQAHFLSQGVEVRLGHIDQAQVIGDPDRLKQLLLNLVSNGLKYTPQGGSVTLELSRDSKWAQVCVSDTGIGIPSEDLPYIFDRFYRVDKARSRAQGGTGLGLAIAQWIAQVHGGKMSVTSEVDKGSTFTLRLPIAPDHTPPDDTEPSPPRRIARNRLNRR